MYLVTHTEDETEEDEDEVEYATATELFGYDLTTYPFVVYHATRGVDMFGELTEYPMVEEAPVSIRTTPVKRVDFVFKCNIGDAVSVRKVVTFLVSIPYIACDCVRAET